MDMSKIRLAVRHVYVLYAGMGHRSQLMCALDVNSRKRGKSVEEIVEGLIAVTVQTTCGLHKDSALRKIKERAVEQMRSPQFTEFMRWFIEVLVIAEAEGQIEEAAASAYYGKEIDRN